MGAEFGRTDERTDTPGEANCRFSQFCERADKAVLLLLLLLLLLL